MKKKCFSLLLLFMMIFNVLVSSTVANVYAKERGNPPKNSTSTNYGVTSIENMEIKEYQYEDDYYGWGGCLKGKFKIPANAKEGDYFTLELPEDILVLQPVNPNEVWFKIKNNQNSKVIANVYLVDKNKLHFVLTGDSTSTSDYEGDFSIGEKRKVKTINGKAKSSEECIGFVPNQSIFYDKNNRDKDKVDRNVEYKTSYHSNYNSGSNSNSKSIQSKITVYYTDERFINQKGRVNIQVAEETKDSITWEVVYNSLNSRYLLSGEWLYDYLDKNVELYHGNNETGLKQDVKVFTATGARHGGYLKETLQELTGKNLYLQQYSHKESGYGYAFKFWLYKNDLSQKTIVLRVKTKKIQSREKSIQSNENKFYHQAYLRVPLSDRRGNPQVAYRHDSIIGRGGVFFEDLKNIKLLKVDKDTKKEISGKIASFGLYKDDVLLRNLLMSKEGIIEINNLKVGDKYKVKELQAPEGYKLDQTKEYTLEVLDNGKYKLDGVEYNNNGNKAKIENEKGEPKKPAPQPPVPTPPKEDIPLTPLNINIDVTKNWHGLHDENISIKVYLVKNGVRTDQFITLNKENIWSDTFKNLPVVEKVGDKEAIKYTVEEENTKDGKVIIDGQTYEVKIEARGDDDFYITNTNIAEPPAPEAPNPPESEEPEEKISITVNKVWQKKDGSVDTEVTVPVKVALYAGDEKIKEIELESSTNPKYEYEFKDLPKFDEKGVKIQYRVKELSSFVDYKTEITGDMEKGFVITNKKIGEIPPSPEPPTPPKPPIVDKPQIPLIPAKTEVKVKKVWEGISKEEAPEITVYLLKNGKRTGESIELNKQNNWMGEFKNLNIVDNINDKQENKYTVEEKELAGYKTVITGDMEKGFVITNTKISERPIPPTRTPEKPNVKEPPTEDKSIPRKMLPKTGDGANVTFYAGLMGLSGTILLLMELKKRKNKKFNR